MIFDGTDLTLADQAVNNTATSSSRPKCGKSDASLATNLLPQNREASGASRFPHHLAQGDLLRSSHKRKQSKDTVNSQERQLARDMRRANRRKERKAPRHQEFRRQHIQTQNLDQRVAWKIQELEMKSQWRLENKNAVFSMKPQTSFTTQENKAANTAKNPEHQMQRQFAEMSRRDYNQEYSQNGQAFLVLELRDREDHQESLAQTRREVDYLSHSSSSGKWTLVERTLSVNSNALIEISRQLRQHDTECCQGFTSKEILSRVWVELFSIDSRAYER